MERLWAHLLGATSMLMTAALWLGLLNADFADRALDNVAGPQNEYKLVFAGGLLAIAFACVAAIRGAKFWYIGVIFSASTVGLFAYAAAA